MAYFIPTGIIDMPDANEADEDGLIAITEDLNPELILHAYKNGIFPWFEEYENFYWYSPSPRCVLMVDDLLVSKSMQKIIRDEIFTLEINTNFDAVVLGCANTPRKPTIVKGILYPNAGTWINENFIKTHRQLLEMGYGFHAIAKQNNEIVGGLFGVKIGNLFCGESMFSTVSNASKFAFIKFVEYLKTQGVQAIDCQMESPHLMSLGAIRMSRKKYLKMVFQLVNDFTNDK
jgi:leucyl/phenylalanyl-tRNA---protein transferase